MEVMDGVETPGPGERPVSSVGHSAGLAKYRPDGFHATRMDIGQGGKRKVPRDPMMKEGCRDSQEVMMHLNCAKVEHRFHTRGHEADSGHESLVGRGTAHVIRPR